MDSNDISRSPSTLFNHLALTGLGHDTNTYYSSLSPEEEDASTVDLLSDLESKLKPILQSIFMHSDFAAYYDTTTVSWPAIHAFTQKSAKYIYLLEVFPIVMNSEASTTTKPANVHELVFHSSFEAVIDRYTLSKSPGASLLDTRPSKFGCCHWMKIEAVSHNSLPQPQRFTLLREFLILQHLWESYRTDAASGRCGPDQLIGFQIPFHFKNVVGSIDYNFDSATISSTYFDIHGQREKLYLAPIPSIVPTTGGTTAAVKSTLSYMTVEKLGPSLSYLLDLMRTHGKNFTVSSAFKVYDQIIARLLVAHRYGVVHCDPNPSSFHFGLREAYSVLYISDFGSSIVRPEPKHFVPRFHDRFVSHMIFREKKCHYVYDLESAFYILLFLLLGCLPWDRRLTGTASSTDDSNYNALQGAHGHTATSMTTEDKEKFWNSQDIFSRALRMVEFEFQETLYRNFSTNLLESLYIKTKESILSFGNTPLNSYARDSNTAGTPVYNAYFGLRKIIATYFQFESLSPALKDMHVAVKVELLHNQGAKDKRIAWDLSSWCWNYLDPGVKRDVSRMVSKIL